MNDELQISKNKLRFIRQPKTEDKFKNGSVQAYTHEREKSYVYKIFLVKNIRV